MSGAMPYFGDAYMADTRHLSLEEHGAYHLLLLIAWRSPNCALPDDDKRIAQMLGITPKKWAMLRVEVMRFWTLTEHGWQQKRQTKERQWVDEKSRKNRAAAEASHRARSNDLLPKTLPAGAESSGDNRNSGEASEDGNSLKNKLPGDADAPPNAVADAHANGHAPPPPPTKYSSEPKGSSPRAWALPAGVSLQVWTDFLGNRKRKRLGNTPTAWKAFLDDLARISLQTGIPPPKLIEMCTAKGWGAIYDPRDQRNERSDADPTTIAVQRLTANH